jgi:hypothetical protein
MPSAIWIILYDLHRARETEYLDWFHHIHIPEKLARPGYTWAAHYRVSSERQSASNDDSDRRYIAMFGGQSTGVFYNPSPAQIKPTQTAKTRDMMTCRANSRSLILSEEWTVNRLGNPDDGTSAIDAPAVSLMLCDTFGNDEDFGSWLVQDHLRSIFFAPECTMARKYLASTGGAKHAVLHEYSDTTAPSVITANIGDGEWGTRVDEYIDYPLGGPLTAARLWPVLRD